MSCVLYPMAATPDQSFAESLLPPKRGGHCADPAASGRGRAGAGVRLAAPCLNEGGMAIPCRRHGCLEVATTGVCQAGWRSRGCAEPRGGCGEPFAIILYFDLHPHIKSG